MLSQKKEIALLEPEALHRDLRINLRNSLRPTIGVPLPVTAGGLFAELGSVQASAPVYVLHRRPPPS